VTFGSWSTAIAAADLPAVHAHLDFAVRHLEDARELVTSLTEDAELARCLHAMDRHASD
jgi:hypothetical protein